MLGVIPAVASPVSARSDIAALAMANGRSERQIQRILADPAARVGAADRIYYVEPAPADPALASNETGPQPGPFPSEQTFLLHSRPGSSRVVYLDFDGHTVAGTAWNTYAGIPSFVAEPFDMDGSPGFSGAERDVIQSVWQRVSEDFAIFDVDVTTEDPGEAALTRSGVDDQRYGSRALITDTYTIADKCGCSGIAYLDVFDEPYDHAYYQPALVFSRVLGHVAKYVAETVSHEVGHNLGLLHDGSSSTSYYRGHGAWAPIMGAAFSKPITQWSKGEYAGADNTEDDLAVIKASGAPLLPDDHGDAATQATVLDEGLTAVASGLISTDEDVDVFRVRAAAGVADLSVSPTATSPNLDLRVELRSAAGAVLASNDPPSGLVSYDRAAGLAASISVPLPTGGDYFLFVSGVGTGSATTGYSGYGSLGRYTVGATLNQPAVGIDSAVNPSSVDQPVNVTASVSVPDGATPTGTVTFDEGATALCRDVPLSSGQAACSVPLGVGSHAITARYGGDATYSAATSPVLTQTVAQAQAQATVAVTSSPSPSSSGQAVTFEAVVSPDASGTNSPTGTVSFSDGASALCLDVAVEAGSATCTRAMTVGDHPISAVYSGDPTYGGATSLALTHSVVPADTTVAVASSSNPVVAGTPVTLSASVSTIAPPTVAPTGTVTFSDGATVLCRVVLSGSVADCTTALEVGSHPVTAVYSGDAELAGATSPVLTQTVDGEPVTVTVASSAEPSVSGQAVGLRATVAPQAGGSTAPTGSVTFTDGATEVCAGVALMASVATCTTSMLVGSHSIVAVYRGDGRFAATTSPTLTQTVGAAGTTVGLVSSSSPVRTAESLTLTATVSVTAPATGSLTGTVTFTEGSTVICGDVPVASGLAMCSPSLPVGTHAITATYGGSSQLAASASPVIDQTILPFGDSFRAVTPARLLDTRVGTGGPAVPLAAGATRDLVVRGGATGVPDTASSVVLNVTATGPSAASYLTVHPAGVARPHASSLNFVAGQTIANLVVVGVGTGGSISIFNDAGGVDVLADVVGYHAPTGGDLLTALTPARLLDTRVGTGGPAVPLAAGATRDLVVRGGATGVPDTASSVVLNVTATGPSASSYLTVHPAGVARPHASSLNFVAGQTIPNLVVAGIGADGRISIYNAAGTVDLVADVVGYHSPTAGDSFTSVTPARLLDTRVGTGGPAVPLGAGATRELVVRGGATGVPDTARSVVLNVTATGPSASSYLTLHPAGVARPHASSLNFVAGQTIPNLVVAGIGADGRISIYNAAGTVHVVADVVGFTS